MTKNNLENYGGGMKCTSAGARLLSRLSTDRRGEILFLPCVPVGTKSIKILECYNFNGFRKVLNDQFMQRLSMPFKIVG